MFLNLKRKKMKTSRKNKNVKESLGGKWKGTIMVAILMKINVAQYFSYLTLCTKWVLLCCLFKLFKSDVELERSQISQVEKLIKPILSACIWLSLKSAWGQKKKEQNWDYFHFGVELLPTNSGRCWRGGEKRWCTAERKKEAIKRELKIGPDGILITQEVGKNPRNTLIGKLWFRAALWLFL